MRISKKVREEAALLCAIAASDNYDGIVSAAWRLDSIEGAQELALEAQAFACSQRRLLTNYAETYAEAEALLRCGWSPE